MKWILRPLGRFVAISLATCLSIVCFANQSPAVLGTTSRPDSAEVQLDRTLIARGFRRSRFSKNEYRVLAEADRFYLEGNLQMAERIASQVKPPFQGGSDISIPKATREADQLDPAAQVYWRNATEGIEQKLESKIFQPLQLLTENYPDFLPGHLKLAEQCEVDPNGCKRNSKAEQPNTALAVLERAGALYPSETMILDARLAYFERLSRGDEKFASNHLLSASISARQFAMTYPDRSESEKYMKLANDYMQRYRRELKREIEGYALANLLIGDKKAVRAMQNLMLGESKFGEFYAEEYKKSVKLIDDPKVTQYVDRVGQKLAELMGRDEFDYKFYVVDDPNLNAIAYPGGKVFINAGILFACRSEAELAGVLGHELAHIALSQRFRREAEMTLMSTISKLIPFGDILNDITTLEYSQNNERDSDLLGTRVLAQSNYSADGLRNFMMTLREQEGGRRESWLSSHPPTTSRIRYIESLIRRNGYNRFAFEGAKAHLAIQKHIEGEGADDSTSPNRNESQGIGSGRTSRTPARGNPASAKRPASRPTGNIEMSISQERDGVTIRTDGAYISRSGSPTIKLVIENKSDREFGFVPVLAQVTDENGKALPARYKFESKTNIVEAGGTLRGQVQIPAYRWIGQDKQGLTLLIKEGTVGARVFRIPI